MTWLLCLFCGSWTRVEVQAYHKTRGVYGVCKHAECRCQVLSMLVVAEKAAIASAAAQDKGPIPSWVREAFNG